MTTDNTPQPFWQRKTLKEMTLKNGNAYVTAVVAAACIN